MHNKSILKIMDANLNRAREGLRVCEDIARFSIGKGNIAKALKGMRHSITNNFIDSGKTQLKELLFSRDVDIDILKSFDFEKPKDVKLADIFMSNIQRVKEALRVIEECCRLIDKDMSIRFRNIRFRVYDLEQKAIKKIQKIKL